MVMELWLCPGFLLGEASQQSPPLAGSVLGDGVGLRIPLGFPVGMREPHLWGDGLCRGAQTEGPCSEPRQAASLFSSSSSNFTLPSEAGTTRSPHNSAHPGTPSSAVSCAGSLAGPSAPRCGERPGGGPTQTTGAAAHNMAGQRRWLVSRGWRRRPPRAPDARWTRRRAPAPTPGPRGQRSSVWGLCVNTAPWTPAAWDESPQPRAATPRHCLGTEMAVPGPAR